MLTIQSNLKIQDLETLSKTLIKPDIINFGLNKVGGGYTDKIADKVIDKLSKLDKDKTIVIINDITLQMADKLLEAGYTNIYLAFGGFNKDGTVSKDKTVYNIMKAVIENNIKEKLNAISLEEIFNMKIDGIIANPPYGAIGANIAYTIREKVDYECFVNLLPANDYKRNKTKDLFNYQSEMEQVEGGFEDASVTTHLALIHKVKINNLTSDEFEISNYTNKHLEKYFLLNTQRNLIYNILQNTISEDATLSFFVPMRLSSGDHSGEHHLPYSKDCLSYKVNTNQLTYSEAAARYASHYDYTGDAHGNYFPGNSILFKSSSSKLNFSNFVYSQSGFKFISCILTAIHKDSRVPVNSWFPKVDWTRPWTVEEILADYGYTEDEIKEVMADLDNFKGMDD